jgi:hypothetical protein
MDHQPEGVTGAYLSAARSVAGLLRSPALAGAWSRPSALAEFRVSGLAGHLARGAFNTETYLAAPAPPADAARVDAVTYFLTMTAEEDLAAEVHRRIRERGEADAGTGPDDLAGRYDAAVARLAATLPGIPESRPVPMVAGHVLALRECLLTRMVELMVHADDLAVSIGVPPPEFADEPADLVIAVLARIARRRRGTPPVLRALARRERAGAEPIAAF